MNKKTWSVIFLLTLVGGAEVFAPNCEWCGNLFETASAQSSKNEYCSEHCQANASHKARQKSLREILLRESQSEGSQVVRPTFCHYFNLHSSCDHEAVSLGSDAFPVFFCYDSHHGTFFLRLPPGSAAVADNFQSGKMQACTLGDDCSEASHKPEFYGLPPHRASAPGSSARIAEQPAAYDGGEGAGGGSAHGAAEPWVESGCRRASRCGSAASVVAVSSSEQSESSSSLALTRPRVMTGQPSTFLDHGRRIVSVPVKYLVDATGFPCVPGEELVQAALLAAREHLPPCHRGRSVSVEVQLEQPTPQDASCTHFCREQVSVSCPGVAGQTVSSLAGEQFCHRCALGMAAFPCQATRVWDAGVEYCIWTDPVSGQVSRSRRILPQGLLQAILADMTCSNPTCTTATHKLAGMADYAESAVRSAQLGRQ